MSITAAEQTSRLYVTPVTGWQVGDEVLVVTTDFDPLQTEVRGISAVAFESGYTTVDLDEPLRYPHFGGYTEEGVDEMAEVANLVGAVSCGGVMC